MASFCTQCGSRHADGARFCTSCGTPVRMPPPSTERSQSEGTLALLRRSPFFGVAPDGELGAIAAHLAPVSFAAGTEIVREGESGDSCFLIDHGEAEVSSRDLIGQEIRLQTYGPGDVIGELALVGAGRPRSATIRSRTDVDAFEITRASFDELEATCPTFAAGARERLERLDLDAFLKRASPFARLPPEALAEVARRAGSIHCDAGATVIKEGGIGDAFYVVRSGRAAAYRGRERLQVYEVGDCFGEVAPLTGARRTATVRALEDTQLVRLAAADLVALAQTQPTLLRHLSELITIRGGTLPQPTSAPPSAIDAALRRLGAGRRKRWRHVLTVGLILFVLAATAAIVTGGALLLVAVIVGSFVGPVTFVTYLAESDLLADRLRPLAATFALAGFVVMPIAAWLEASLLGVSGVTGSKGVAVGLIEETLKLLAIVPLLRRRQLRFERDGLIYGAAAGMGFAAIESALYAYTFGQSTVGTLGVVAVRAVLSPFGHGTWTAIVCAAIWRQKGAGKPRLTASVVRAFVLAVTLHGLWDWQPFPGPAVFPWSVAIGIVGLLYLRVVVRRAAREAGTAALALNPELAATGPVGPTTLCGNCQQVSLPGAHYCARCGAALHLPAPRLQR